MVFPHFLDVQNAHTRPREANMMLCGTVAFASDIKVLVESVFCGHEIQGNADTSSVSGSFRIGDMPGGPWSSAT